MKYEGLIYTQGQYPRPNESKDSFEIELSEEPVVGRGSRETIMLMTLMARAKKTIRQPENSKEKKRRARYAGDREMSHTILFERDRKQRVKYGGVCR